MSNLENAAQDWLNGESEEAEAPEIEVEQDESDGVEAEAEFSEPTAEDLARQRGWKSRDEWKGPVPQNFVDDPEDFNRQYETSNPNLVKQNKDLIERIERQERVFQQWLERQQEADRREQQRLASDIERRIADAVKLGDQNAAKSAIRDRDELTRSSQPQYDPNNDPAFKAWVSTDDAAWYRESNADPNDPRVAYAQRVVAPKLAQQGVNPQANPDYYARISREINQAFGAPAKQAPARQPAVEGARRSAAPRTKPKEPKWADLPRAVREDRDNAQILKSLYRGDKDKFAADWQKQNGQKNG